MKPRRFDYARPDSVAEALALLAEHGEEGKILAGGQSLVPVMNFRLARPARLFDLNGIAELDFLRAENGTLRIGALTRHRELLESDLLAERFPIIRDAEKVIADPLVRNRGTIGGALCQADPSEDLGAVCAALKASAVIVGSGGERIVPMTDFHKGPYETAVSDGEMLTEVRLPLHDHAGSAYEKVERRAGDWAVAAAGAALWMDGGTIAEAGIGLSAVGAPDMLSARAEDALRGQRPSEELFAEAGRLASEDCNPTTDQRGSVEYKRHLAQELTTRAVRRAAERALS